MNSTAEKEVTVSKWRTYKNPKYGFEIKVPYNWFFDKSKGYAEQLSDFESEVFNSSKAPFCGGYYPDMSISVVNNPGNLSAEAYVKQDIEKDIVGDPKLRTSKDPFPSDIDVAIVEGYSGGGAPGPVAYINTKKGKIIIIFTEKSISGLVYEIFSSFRFIAHDPVVEDVKLAVLEKNVFLGDIQVTDGESTKIITDWGYSTSPILSPDKKKIAYLSETKESLVARDYNKKKNPISYNIWVVNLDGKGASQVTQHKDEVFRTHLYWLDENRLLFVDGRESVKVYDANTKQTEIVVGSVQPIPNSSDPHEELYVFNSDYTYLVRFLTMNGRTQVTSINLSNLQVKDAKDAINYEDCNVRFGEDNKTFIGVKGESSNSERAILNLETGNVSYMMR